MSCPMLLTKIYFDEIEFIEYLKNLKIKCMKNLNISTIKSYVKRYNIKDEKKNKIFLTYIINIQKSNKIECDNSCKEFIKKINDKTINFQNNKFQLSDDLESQYYYCSKNIYFPSINIYNSIYTLIQNCEYIIFNDIYNFLRKKYNVKSFNRKNLLKFIERYFIIRNDRVSLRDDFKVISYNKQHLKSLFFELIKLAKVLDLELLYSVFTLGVERFLSCLKGISECDFIIDINQETINSFFVLYKLVSQNDIDLLSSKYQLFDKWYEQNEKKIYFEMKLLTSFHVLMDIIKKIPINNYNFKLKYLITNDKFIDLLNEKNIYTVTNFINNFTYDFFCNCYNFFDLIYSLLKSLETDFIFNIINNFASIFADEKDKMILEMRSKGISLECIGNELSLTRERIRQIEEKLCRKFTKIFLIKTNYLNIIKSFYEDSLIISRDNIHDIFKEYTNSFIYLVSKCKLTNFIYIDNLDIISCCGINWYDNVLKSLKHYPKIITEPDFANILYTLKNELENQGIELRNIDLRKVITTSYKPIGRLFTRIKLSVRDIYYYLIDKFFPDGVYFYSDNELDKFKSLAIELFDFKDIIYKSNRSIISVINRFTILVDKGKYNIIRKVPKINESLLREIENYINFANISVMYSKLYYIFENKLQELKINNKYMFQGILKRSLNSNIYYFHRDYVSKVKSNSNMHKIIIKLALSKNSPFSINDILENNPYLNKTYIKNKLNEDKRFIPLTSNTYIQAKNIKINKTILQAIVKLIDYNFIDDIVSSKRLYDVLVVRMPEFLDLNHINSHYFLFGVLKNILTDRYEFKRPFIARKGVRIRSSNERIDDYIYGKNSFLISELRDFVYNCDLNLNNMLYILEQIKDDYIRVNDDLVVNKNLLNINENILRNIEFLLNMYLGTKNGLNLKNIKKFNIFPKINYQWNKYLLSSLIKCYLKNFKVLFTTNNYHNTEFIIVRKKLNVSNYLEYVEIMKGGS